MLYFLLYNSWSNAQETNPWFEKLIWYVEPEIKGRINIFKATTEMKIMWQDAFDPKGVAII